jgi:hypothetical protein
MLQGALNLATSAMFLVAPGIIRSLGEYVPSFFFSIFTALFSVFVIAGILQIIAGITILSAAPWSWSFGVGTSIIGLFCFPIGTMLAILCLLILFSYKEELDAERSAKAKAGGNDEWPLILGTILVVAGILWALASYMETPYAWALAFGIIGIALFIIDRALRTQTKGLEALGEVSIAVGVFLALFVSNMSIDYIALPIIACGLLIILAYYISKRNRGVGRLVAILSIAAVIGALCSPLYSSYESDKLDNEVKYTIPETSYTDLKEIASIESSADRYEKRIELKPIRSALLIMRVKESAMS